MYFIDLSVNRSERILMAQKCLKGISIGDAFGESFFGETDLMLDHIRRRTIPETTWEFTDDTVMAIAVFEELESYGEINQNSLAKKFARNHEIDPNRGYGATARTILRSIGEGGKWQELSQEVFEGMGSMGNGASMRVGTIGAYYFDDLDKVRVEALKSAEVTHSNVEAICGAIAVAIATAISTRLQIENKEMSCIAFIKEVLKYLPDCDTKSKISKSLSIPYSYNIETVKSILGNGSKILAKDTVPFSLWCASNNLNNFEESQWKAVSVLGDRDTICAIVGGITAMSSKPESLPARWMKAVEDLNECDFRTKK